MMRGILSVATLVSVVLFPWLYTALLALAAATVEPFVPLAAGLLLDTLYYVPYGGALPLGTIVGGMVTIIASVVHSRLRPGMIGR